MPARFIDEYPPGGMLSLGFVASPLFSTQMARVDSGASNANRRWLHPLRRFSSPQGIRCHEEFEAVKDHWLVMGGPAQTFPIRDPTDFASAPLIAMDTAAAPTMLDQVIGVGNGAQQAFPLLKTYARGATSYVRRIYLPVVNTLLLALDGVAELGYTVDRYSGIVTFTAAPADGAVITAGYYFDVEVRFESDDTFDGIVKSMKVSGFADVPMVEERPC